MATGIIAEAQEVAEQIASSTPLKVLGSEQEISTVIDQYDAFLFDCDGVLWRGGKLLACSDTALAMLRRKGKRIFFVTNNSTKSRAQYAKKLHGLGIEATLDDIVPSSWAAAEYLSTEQPQVRKAFVVGSHGLEEELANVGIACVGGQDPAYANKVFATEQDFAQVEPDPEVGAVVCGWDLTFNYAKLCLASLYMQRNAGCVLVATNKDAFDRLDDRNMPGNGCAVAAIETAVGRAAITVGKPSHWLISRLIAKFGLDPRRTVIVGDRLDTDILLGAAGGTDSILVCTGCVGLEEVRGLRPGEQGTPTYVLSHVGRMVLDGEGGDRNGNGRSAS